MPWAPKHPCAHAGCPALVEHGRTRCDPHQREHQRQDAATRGSAQDRGYGADWQRATRDYLTRHPWCARCEREGRRTRSTLVGHKQAIRHNPARRLDPSNWEALCVSCNTTQAHEDNAKHAARVQVRPDDRTVGDPWGCA
jgi:5-methylcytosine-specific restriction enzyme A